MASRFDGGFQVFRIASAAYPVFDGGGAHRWGSRWCTPGRRVIHTSSAYSLALLENLVHWNSARLPPGNALRRGHHSARGEPDCPRSRNAAGVGPT